MKTIQIIAGLVTMCLGIALFVLAWVSAVSLVSLAYCVAEFIGATGYAILGTKMIVGIVGGIIPIAIFVIAVATVVFGIAIMIGAKK